MKVQFLASVKKDRHGKVARLKEFELPAIKLNQNKVEIITSVRKPSRASSAQKIYCGWWRITCFLYCSFRSLEDLEKYRNIAYNNNNETSSSAPKVNPHEVVHPSLTLLPVTYVGNCTYGIPPKAYIGQTPSFQQRPIMATLVRSV
jgi:hypothetical protein